MMELNESWTSSAARDTFADSITDRLVNEAGAILVKSTPLRAMSANTGSINRLISNSFRKGARHLFERLKYLLDKGKSPQEIITELDIETS